MKPSDRRRRRGFREPHPDRVGGRERRERRLSEARERAARVKERARAGRDRRERARAVDADGRGYRSSRRTSKSTKSKKRKDISVDWGARARELGGAGAFLARRTGILVGAGAAALAALVLVLFLLATAINGFARWNARRAAADPDTGSVAAMADDNLLVIGAVEGEAVGFLALKVEADEQQVVGIGILDATLMQVPGRGFERISDSYDIGPDVSMSTVANFLGVPFAHYVVVDDEAYQSAMQTHDLSGVLGAVSATNILPGDLGRISQVFDETPPEDVLIVPLPSEAIALGDVTYYEPQLDQLSDLMLAWWGVSPTQDDGRLSIIVYNGSGVPGIAGVAAQELIHQGHKVVEIRNADTFDYAQTLVYLYRGEEADAIAVRDILGVGTVVRQTGDQEIADVIVIVGQDYAQPEQDG